jgi:hypothetical protein
MGKPLIPMAWSYFFPLLFPLPIHVLHTAMIAFGGFRFAVAEFMIAEHGAAGA